MSRRMFVSVAFLLLGALGVVSAHAQPLATTNGRVIEAADGDLVVLPHGAKVALVTRSQVHARLVYLAAQQTLLLLTDPGLGGIGDMPDTKGFRRWQVRGPWPLEPRWEGSATIDEYLPFARSPLMLAIHSDRGTIVVAPATGMDLPNAPPAVAVVRTSSSSGRPVRGSFDEIEQAWLAGGDSALPGPAGALPRGGVRLRMDPAGGGPTPVAPGTVAPPPLRVGGGIRPPARTQNVNPVYPPAARSAGVQGVVILEVTVGEDGAVSDARILRSIPMLDAAALDAVKQWRYEPTLLNGVPRSIIMTVTVNFTLAPSDR